MAELAAPTDASTHKLDRTTLGHQIAEVIRNDILFGRLAPGERVSQQMLCDRYGTSRMPVRDALRQLAYEGFITIDDKSHSIVAPFRRHDLADIYLIEGMLHGLATRRVTELADDAALVELRGYHDEMLAAEGAGDPGRMAEVNWRFHRRLNQMANSPKLIAVLRTHTMSIPRGYIKELPHWMRRANDQHGAVVEAMVRGDAAKAEELMVDHVVDAGNDLLDYLESCGVAFDE